MFFVQFTLEIMATDSNNASTLLKPIIKMCACKNGGKCVHDLSGLGTPYAYRAFYLMGCSCPKNVNGRFCQNSPADLCSQGSGSPCFPTAKCRSTKNGIKCGKCPDGYVDDGTTCTGKIVRLRCKSSTVLNSPNCQGVLPTWNDHRDKRTTVT